MNAKYTVVSSAAGASRLYAGAGSASLVAEHRDWLHEAYHERADEAPGVIQLLGPDGAVKRTTSGWALGGSLSNGEMAWVEEVGDEYHYRIARSNGRGASLNPPGDGWVIAGAVGHTAASLGAVVLWRPVAGTSPRLPATRQDQLWIAAVDRETGAIVDTRELTLTLPWERTQGILLGGPAAAPILLLVTLPDPGGPPAYQTIGFRLPKLEDAWQLPLDVARAQTMVAAPPVSSFGRQSVPLPGSPHLDGDSLRTLHAFLGAPLGDGSGWLLAHGGLVGRVLVPEIVFLIGADGAATVVSGIHVPGTDQISPVVEQPGVLVLGKAGGRDNQHFVSIDLVWPALASIETLADQRTKVAGRALGSAPDLIPMSAAMRGDVLFVAPPIVGDGLGADSPDVRHLQTTPTYWHQADRPRVLAHLQWLKQRATGR